MRVQDIPKAAELAERLNEAEQALAAVSLCTRHPQIRFCIPSGQAWQFKERSEFAISIEANETIGVLKSLIASYKLQLTQLGAIVDQHDRSA